MAEFRKLPTQAELQNMLFMEQMRVKNPQQIAQEALASGTTVRPIPENVFQKIAGGARTAGEFVNRAGSAADLAKLFPGYKPETKVTIPTGYNFAPKQDPMGGVIPGGLQTQNVNLGQVLGAIKPADVLGISGAERAYSDIGAGKAPQPLDVLDVAGLGATGLVGGKAALRATRSVPVGMSIQEAKGLLETAPKSDIGFYSAVEQAALATPRKSGTGQAFLNDISKGQDVRADEIKWMGLDDFLKGKQNVTRQEVQDYIANNRVNVEEVALGDIKSTALYKEQSLANNLASLINKNEDSSIRIQGTQGKVFSDEALYYLQDGTVTPNQFPPELQNAATSYLKAYKEAQSATNTPSKFGQYTLPGGENYRELLLTMPSKLESKEAISQRMFGKPYKQLTDEERFQVTPEFQKSMGENYNSPHFDQPNILAHLRVNDRVDADGKKMLLIEEVQSDWHQAGRDKGYKGQLTSLPDDYFVSEMQNKAGDTVYEIRKTSNPNVIINRDYNRQSAINGAINTLNETVMGVPDAPFKDTWYQLALKRAIQHAAENGYDRIGLTTGSQQAARFDLSKQLSRVAYQDGVLHGYDKSGALVMNRSVAPNELPDYVGKELGKTMAENAAKDAEIRNKISVARYERKPESEINALRSQLDGVKTDYAGLDLQVGGEGMKKYYDEIYPKFLDKYGKKWGARVGETSVSIDNGFIEPIPSGGWKQTQPTQETIRYIDITPEMKAGVSKGQPLFMAAPIGAGLLGSESMTPER